MAAWLAPALKAVLPHLGTIVSAVVPVFTRKKADSDQMQLLQDQIAELQSASSQNAEYIKDLASQLQTTVSALEQTASIAETKTRWVLWFSIAAVTLSVISMGIATFLLLTR